MLQWFVEEQVEEEANADEILQQLKMLEGNPHGILMLDRELKQIGTNNKNHIWIKIDMSTTCGQCTGI